MKRSHRQLAEAEPAPSQGFWNGGTPKRAGSKPWCCSAQGIEGAWWFVEWNGGSAATAGAVVPKWNGTKHRSDSGAPESPTPTAFETPLPYRPNRHGWRGCAQKKNDIIKRMNRIRKRFQRLVPILTKQVKSGFL